MTDSDSPYYAELLLVIWIISSTIENVNYRLQLTMSTDLRVHYHALILDP